MPEEIAVVSRLIDVNLKSGLDKIRNAIGDTINATRNMIGATKAVGVSTGFLTGRLFDTRDVLTEGTGVTKEQVKAWDDARESQMEFGKELTRFSAEYLSSMFLFMEMSKSMQGLIAPSMEMVGATKLLSTTMGLGFLPFAIKLMPILLMFMKVMMWINPTVMMVAGSIIGLLVVYFKLRSAHNKLFLGLRGIAEQMKIVVREGDGVRVMFRKIMSQKIKNIKQNRLVKFTLGLITGAFRLVVRGGELLLGVLKKVWDRMEKVKTGSKGMSGGFNILGMILPILTLISKAFLGVLIKIGAVIVGIGLPFFIIIGLLVYLYWLFTSGKEKIKEWGEKTWEAIVKLQAKFIMFVDEIKKKWSELKTKISEKLKPIVEWFQEKWDKIQEAREKAHEWFYGKVWNPTVEWIREKWGLIQDSRDKAHEWFANKIYTPTVEWINEKWDDIEKAFDNLGEWLDKPKNMIINWVIGLLPDWLVKFLDFIGIKIPNPTEEVNKGLKDVKENIDSCTQGFSSMNDSLNTTKNALDSLIKPVNPYEELDKSAKNLGETISKATTTVTTTTGTKGILESVSSAVRSIGSSLLSGVKSVFGFQEGGIVTRPTFGMIGERGPEAVIPLNRFAGKTTNIYASPTFNITASISSDIDVEELANDLNARFEETVRTLIR